MALYNYPTYGKPKSRDRMQGLAVSHHSKAELATFLATMHARTLHHPAGAPGRPIPPGRPSIGAPMLQRVGWRHCRER